MMVPLCVPNPRVEPRVTPHPRTPASGLSSNKWEERQEQLPSVTIPRIDLAGLTQEQYRLLIERLEKLPDVKGN
jgi:hypothetical protein